MLSQIHAIKVLKILLCILLYYARQLPEKLVNEIVADLENDSVVQ